MEKFYAHSTDSPDKSGWQLLEDHLRGVARLAEGFAAVFGAGPWGRYAGLFHDAGKATKAFVQRLEGRKHKVDHSTFGARLAQQRAGRLGLLLSYVIAGHHGGLPDGGFQEKELHFRLKGAKVPPDVSLVPDADIQEDLFLPFQWSREYAGFNLSFFTRMIFSCLVDADFLDTEAFCNPGKAQERPALTTWEDFCALKERLDSHLTEMVKNVELTPVNLIRRKVLEQCRDKAKCKPQFFSLTVPTGGGKTLSSLAFALNHATAHQMRRVIYAIPFTSIIEQNAQVFQEILGRSQVLEHHCNYKEDDSLEEAVFNRFRGLIAENWDAPIVVTTNVQFFESLFSNKPSRCRKLHNISRSVIILDEAQAIPTMYIEPCLAALRELVDHYGCTVVLCTATQPALDDNRNLRNAIPEINEIVADARSVYQALRRTEARFVGKLADKALIQRIEAEKQVLCIVSTKPHARILFQSLTRKKGVFHLSTNMYPEHRKQVFNDIRNALKQKKRCRVISTSLVEAGVDLDFPIVYRAMAGLDSIAQAAGRCNREGRMPELGKVYIFESEKSIRIPWLNRCASRAGEALRSYPDTDPMGLSIMRRYFELLYDVEALDKKQIMSRLNPRPTRELFFSFREAAQEFSFIENDSIGVIVPIAPEVEKLLQQLRYTEFPRAIIRKLQPYSVSVRMDEFSRLKNAGAIEMLHDHFPVLYNLSVYKENVGICVDEGDIWDANDLIQ